MGNSFMDIANQPVLWLSCVPMVAIICYQAYSFLGNAYRTGLAMGMEVPTMDHYVTGKMFIRYSWDMLGDIGQFEKITINGELTSGT